MISDADKKEVQKIMEDAMEHPPGTDLSKVLPAWNCTRCGQKNAGYAAECGRCELAKQPEAGIKFITPQPIKFGHIVATLYDAAQQAVNWLDMGHPELARITLLKALGAPIRQL